MPETLALPSVILAKTPRAFLLLVKPTGATWTTKTASFLSMELFYQDSRFHMMDEVLKASIRELLEAHLEI
jgi:hypothetical protein